MSFQLRSQPGQRPRPMAQAVFDVLTQLSERLLITGGNEKRVVTEASTARRAEGDGAFANALEQFGLPLQFIGIADRRGADSRLRDHGCQRQDAAESSRPLIRRNVF